MGRIQMAILAVFVMFGSAFAQDSRATAKQSTQPKASVTTKQWGYSVKTVVVTPQDFNKLPSEMRAKLRAKMDEALASLPFSPNVCYTMNSFVFKRYNGGDATRLVKQTTCTPGSYASTT